MVVAEMVGVDRVLSMLESLKPGVATALKEAMDRQAVALQNLVRNGFLSGQIDKHTGLNVGKTGYLKRSITQKVTGGDGRYEGIVGTNINYGVMWEQGFDRRVGFRARNGKYEGISQHGLARIEAKHPSGSRHYRKQFLVPAFTQLAPSIRAALHAAVQNAVKR